MSRHEPLELVSTVEALSRALRRRILEGSLAPGTRLPEAEIAETYGVGRYTVRSALQDLVYRGMAEHAPHRGVSVLEPTTEIVRDVYAFRAGLECEAARLVVERRSLDQPKRALEVLEAVPHHAPWPEILHADLGFHRAVVDSAGSPRMSRAFEMITDQLMVCLTRVRDPAPGIIADHRQLLKALSAGDADRAAAAFRAHLYAIVDELGAGDGVVRTTPPGADAA